MKLALAGDTMLGRGVGDRLATAAPESLFAPEILAAAAEADVFVLNLECCISERGEPAPRRVFHFRAPPAAVDALLRLGVDCVTLANNHALDFGPAALEDTLHYLDAAGIVWVGAGMDVDEAREPRILGAGDFSLGVVALSDDPVDYAAGSERPGVAYADLRHGDIPAWVAERVAALECDTTLVMTHWGPNMAAEPVPRVREAAAQLIAAGGTLVAGHSAHVFHGVAPRVVYDLGDFLDDYRVDPKLRNDLGLLFLVDLASDRLEAIPLKLEFAHTRLATGGDFEWIVRRFTEACDAFGTSIAVEEPRLLLRWR